MNKYHIIFSEVVRYIKASDLHPKFHKSSSSASHSEVRVEQKKVVNFGSNNYLGLSNHARVKGAVRKALKRYGVSSGATRVLGGTHDIHEFLENKLAEFLMAEDSLVFSSGYMANVGVIPSISNLIELPGLKPILSQKEEMAIFSDSGNHGSIHDAIKLSTSNKHIFEHNDVRDLEKKLSIDRSERKLIITQGVFTTDGSIAPLKKIVDLKRKYDCMLLVDDADGIGILGEHGRGTLEKLEIDVSDIDILMGSLTKAFGAFGGFIAGSKDIITYLRMLSKTAMLSAPLPPILCAAAIESLRLIPQMSKQREQVIDLADELRNKLLTIGLNVLHDETPVVLVEIGDEKKSIEMAERLLGKGFYVPVVRYPAVSWGKARLRLTVTSLHDQRKIDSLVQAFLSISKE